MIPLPTGHRTNLRRFFLPERPGPQTALHVIRERTDGCFVDRWPEPRAVAVLAPGDLVLAGDSRALRPADLRAFTFRGMIEAPTSFLPLLERTYRDLRRWPRIVGTLEGRAAPSLPAEITVRRLTVGDEALMATIDPGAQWLWRHYGDPGLMAASGLAWAAIAAGECVSIALPFTRGERYEDLAVFTDPALRRMGLSTACVANLIEDVRGRGRIPSWGTSPRNVASVRVAEKMGFRKDRDDTVYITGVETPR